METASARLRGFPFDKKRLAKIDKTFFERELQACLRNEEICERLLALMKGKVKLSNPHRSYVGYALSITDEAPNGPPSIWHDNELPDIDVDFNDTKREQVFVYLAEKYGAANISRIGNISSLKSRSVIARTVEKFGIPEHEKFKLYDVLIEYSSGDARYGKGLEDTLTTTEVGKAFAARHPEAMLMTELENHASHTSVHAAGVIVSNQPVSDYCTVGPDGVAQIDKPDAEKLNLLKIDALGLRTLGIMEDAGVMTPDQLYNLKLDDPKVLDVFNRQRFAAVFQFEGAAQRQVASEVNVDSFRIIDHITALARPGPLGGGAATKYVNRKAGKEPVVATHPRMGEILGDTFGVVLYQEQVMRIVRELGDFSWEDTTTIRKAMSGRMGTEFFNQKGELFRQGCLKVDIDHETADKIWQEICNFGAWGMNRCFFYQTECLLAHPNQFDGRKVTIKELYRRYKKEPSSWIRQQKVMPKLLSVGRDGRARPTFAKDILKTGRKHCVRLVFVDGRRAECTADHRFIINGKWLRCGDAAPGDEFAAVEREQGGGKNNALAKGYGWTKGRKWKNGRPPELNGKSRALKLFKNKMKGKRCQEKGCKKKSGRMEVHHNDFCGGGKRPNDLVWLCNNHHKQRHIDYGDRRAPCARGHQFAPPAILKKIKSIGEQETYDIEMPGPHHNFVLANGIVTHNSHTCSYAVISYWCAWHKVYAPLEYAAACLRSAKDDAGALAVLREMAAEGVQYTAFDPELSEANWSVKGGRLIGGWMNLEGVGPSKAKAALEKRAAGTLDVKKYGNMKVKFADLFPIKAEYHDLYRNPEKYGCAEGSVILTSDQFPNEGNVLYIGKIMKKRPFDVNEDRRVARRGGKRYDGPTQSIDFMSTDDMGETIMCRVDRFNWDSFGRPANEQLSVGDIIMVRGRRVPNFKMLNVFKMKCLNKPGLEWAVKERRWHRN